MFPLSLLNYLALFAKEERLLLLHVVEICSAVVVCGFPNPGPRLARSDD